MSAPSPLRAAFFQALKEAWSGGAGALLPAGFFASAAVLVPLTLGPEGAQLSSVAGAVLWISLALSSLVTMERLFQADLEDGALELWAINEVGLSQIALVKTFAHWLVSGYRADCSALLCPDSYFRRTHFGKPGRYASRSLVAGRIEPLCIGGCPVWHGSSAKDGG